MPFWCPFLDPKLTTNHLNIVVHFYEMSMEGLHKVSGPNLVNYLFRHLYSEWWVVRCISKNGHQKDILCFNKD